MHVEPSNGGFRPYLHKERPFLNLTQEEHEDVLRQLIRYQLPRIINETYWAKIQKEDPTHRVKPELHFVDTNARKAVLDQRIEGRVNLRKRSSRFREKFPKKLIQGFSVLDYEKKMFDDDFAKCAIIPIE